MVPPPGRHVTFRPWASLAEISFAASILRTSTMAFLVFSIANVMMVAVSALPSARVRLAILSCLFRWTRCCFRYASWLATYLTQ